MEGAAAFSPTALLIGLMVAVVIVVAAQRASLPVRVVRVFAMLGGLLTYIVLLENPALLAQYATEIVVALLGLLLAFIAFLRRRL